MSVESERTVRRRLDEIKKEISDAAKNAAREKQGAMNRASRS